MNKKLNFRVPAAMALGLVMSANAYAQDVNVTGTIIDDLGEPVLGANVVVKGTANGATTDLDGNFSFNAAKGSTLVISFIGYKSQEVVFDGKPLNITLVEDSEMLEDVVVIGYGVAKKTDLTGSVTAIKPDEKNKGVVTNPQDMLQGKIAGVNVTTGSGAPGTGASIRIRGGSSLNASNDPLIVIDGLAMDNQGVKGLSNPLSMVNPADIETFTVLKDASATAIYGSRGSNGVIIITTKKGRAAQAPSIAYNGNVSVSTVKDQLDVMDADEYRAFIKSYYGEDSEAYGKLGTSHTDWQKEIYQTAISHDHNLTISGGLKNMPYRVSLGYTDQEGILKTSDFKRTTASFNLSPSLLDRSLTINVNGKWMHAETSYANTGAIGNANRFDPTQPVKAADDKKYNAADYQNFNGYFLWTDKANFGDSSWATAQNSNATYNPVAQLMENDNKAYSNSYIGNVEVDYKVPAIDELHLHMNFAGDYSTGNQFSEQAKWGPSNPYYGSISHDSESKFNLTYSAYAQYLKDFTDKNHFDLMAGYEWSHMKYWGSNWWQSEKSGSGKWMQESYLVSFFGRMNYSYDSRYLFTATLRADGSSRFKKHWSLFPSAAAVWHLSQEEFLKDNSALSDLKLRLSYGQTGQQDGLGNYAYFASYNANTLNNDGRYPIVGLNDSGLLNRPDAYNQDLTWETTTTYNVGLDFGFFNQRLTGTVDVYDRKTTDLLNLASVSAGSNFRNQVWSNIGDLENKGVEMAITWRPVQTRDWQWEITANATYNHNEITKLTGESSKIKHQGISAGTGNQCMVWTPGQPHTAFYVYQQVYDEKGHAIEGAYVDRNADGQITDDDLYIYKQAAAPWIFGLSSRINYKNWDLGFSAHANVGNYVYNDNEAGFVNVYKTYDSSFSYTHNITKNAANLNWSTYDNVLSDYFVQNASFFKLDNITLGYSFDSLFKSASYKGLSGRVYATVNNVLTITNYEGIDPEVSGGVDNNIYPRPFSALLGLSLNF